MSFPLQKYLLYNRNDNFNLKKYKNIKNSKNKIKIIKK